MSDTVLDRVVACLGAALGYDQNVRVAPVALLWPDEGAQWKPVMERDRRTSAGRIARRLRSGHSVRPSVLDPLRCGRDG